jgi:ribonuclease HII
VVACSLCFNPKNKPKQEFLSRLDDSKKLTKKKRAKLFAELIDMSM